MKTNDPEAEVNRLAEILSRGLSDNRDFVDFDSSSLQSMKKRRISNPSERLTPKGLLTQAKHPTPNDNEVHDLTTDYEETSSYAARQHLVSCNVCVTPAQQLPLNTCHPQFPQMQFIQHKIPSYEHLPHVYSLGYPQMAPIPLAQAYCHPFHTMESNLLNSQMLSHDLTAHRKREMQRIEDYTRLNGGY